MMVSDRSTAKIITTKNKFGTKKPKMKKIGRVSTQRKNRTLPSKREGGSVLDGLDDGD